MPDLLVDTDVFSAGFRFDKTFEEFYGPAIQGNRALVSFMTVAELEFGMLNRRWGEKRKQALREDRAKDYLECGVTSQICRYWAEVVWEAKSIGRVLNTADAWIAATAMALDIPLVTHNALDFDYLTKVRLVTAPRE